MLTFLHVVVSLIILLRTVCYQKPPGASYKPVMAAIAYLIIVAAAYDIFTLAFTAADLSLSALFYKMLLAAALINSRGNVVDLFITRYQALKFIQWYQHKYDQVTAPFNKLPPIHVAPRGKSHKGSEHA